MRYLLNRYYVIIALSAVAVWRDWHSPSSPYQYFLLYLLIKGILQNHSSDVMHIFDSMVSCIEHKD
jgi:hypothetical protein